MRRPKFAFDSNYIRTLSTHDLNEAIENIANLKRITNPKLVKFYNCIHAIGSNIRGSEFCRRSYRSEIQSLMVINDVDKI